MTTVALCASIEQAEVLRSLLADCGVTAYLPDRLAVSYPPIVGGIRVQVADEDAEAARAIVAEKSRKMDAYERAQALVDSAHGADPNRAADGRPAELVYAERMERWLLRIVPGAEPLLRLAARCQHLERWSVPRASFPDGRAGYLQWRRSLYGKQADRARELLLSAGVPAEEAGNAAAWVAKTELKANPGSQALEDAAVLVFLENEIESFAQQHTEYPRDKFVDILRKTWRKMSPRAQEFARGLDLPAPIAALVREAAGT